MKFKDWLAKWLDDQKRLGGSASFKGALSARFISKDGTIKDLGIIATKLVTDAFVAYLTDSLQDSTTTPMDALKYHDSGTGVVAENVGDTALGTPCGEARDIGTQIEGASVNIYKTVATHTYAATFAITEHGVFSAASGATLLDRSLFGAINVVSGDKIEFTYELTSNSGG